MALAALVVIGCRGTAASPPPPRTWNRTLDLADHVGWYRSTDSATLLVTEGARGGLRVYDFENDRTTRLLPREHPDSLLWIQPGGVVEWKAQWMGGASDSLSFVWSEGRASKLDGPYWQRSFDVQIDTLTLRATVFVPRGPGKFPGAVMLHGSGDSDRDNSWYMRIVDHLARNGIAVIFADKRGSGRSTGDWPTASFQDLASDGLALAAALRAFDEVNRASIGFVGISQGGWIGPLAATRDSSIRWVIDVSGAAVRPSEQLLYESRATLRQSHFGWFARPFAPIAAAVARRRQPVFWELNGKFDPMPYWTQMSAAGLVIYGAADAQDNVPVEESVRRLAVLRPKVETHVLPNVGHALAGPNGIIVPEALLLMSRWIVAVSNTPH